MRKKCQGSVLIFSLIVLGILLFTISALVYTTSTSTIVAGNLNFKSAAIKEADLGLYKAVKALIPCGVEPCNKVRDENYIAFEEIPEQTLLASASWNDSEKYVHTISEPNARYKVQYIIDRLSDDQLASDVHDHEKVRDHSYGIIIEDTKGSNDASDGSNVIMVPVVFYRVTVRVEGPSNTRYMTQAIVTVEEF